MCLTMDRKATKELRAEIKDKGLILVYKYLKYVNGKLQAPIMKNLYYKPGLYELVKVKPRGTKILTGFHCYLNKQTAERKAKVKTYSNYKFVCVPFYVRPCDLIGTEITKDHSVFARAILFQKDYDEAMSKVAKEHIKSV